MLNFKRLAKQDKNKFNEVIKNHYYRNAESSFVSLYLWADEIDIQVAFGVYAMYLSFNDTAGKKAYLAPFIYDMDVDINKAFSELSSHMKAEGRAFCIKGVIKEVRDKIEKEIKTEHKFYEDRDNYDYIYKSEDLINLTGKKYNKKRNHLNYFLNHHAFEYKEYDLSLKAECLRLVERWVAEKGEQEGLDNEINVLKKILKEYEDLGVKGAVIYVDGRIEALTFGEALNKDTALIHIEKANQNIRGLYPFINQQFIKNEWSEYEFVNREEDLGIEGLRKAKMSYYPHYLLEKYSCSVDGDCDGL